MPNATFHFYFTCFTKWQLLFMGPTHSACSQLTHLRGGGSSTVRVKRTIGWWPWTESGASSVVCCSR